MLVFESRCFVAALPRGYEVRLARPSCWEEGTKQADGFWGRGFAGWRDLFEAMENLMMGGHLEPFNSPV